MKQDEYKGWFLYYSYISKGNEKPVCKISAYRNKKDTFLDETFEGTYMTEITPILEAKGSDEEEAFALIVERIKKRM